MEEFKEKISPPLSKDSLINEMNGLREKAQKASSELDAARVNFERHVGALEALNCLLANYFPEEKSDTL